MSMLKRLFALFALLALAACGGGSSNTKAPDDDGTAKVDDLNLVLSAVTLDNGGTNTVTATVTALDSRRNTVSAAPVTFSVDGNAVLTASDTATNSSGVLTATVGIGADRSSRAVTVTAKSGSIVKSASFSVYGATLTASVSPTIEVGSSGAIEYQLKDIVGTAMPDSSISITLTNLSAAGGPSVISSTTSKTNSQGKYNYTFAAPTTAGTLRVVATAAGESLSSDIRVVTADDDAVPDASPAPVSKSLTPTPSVVNVNAAGKDTNQVELRALFVGPGDTRVQNVRVVFSLADDSLSYGTVTAVAGRFTYSDATGVARGTFVPGVRSSPTGGVTVVACWDVTDFAVGACPNRIESKLTIASEALSVNIGANELITEGGAKLTYIKQFVVMVVDAAGQAKADVTITPSVDLLGYYKGQYVQFDGGWAQVLSAPNRCPNEDSNRNGALEDDENLNGNGNGIIDPAKADVSIRMVSSKTDAAGMAIAQIEYPKDRASWIDYEVTVTASGIAGTESKARYVGNLPIPASAVASEDVSPAFVYSPYGRAASCADPD
jgi:hypothetical protein